MKYQMPKWLASSLFVLQDITQHCGITQILKWTRKAVQKENYKKFSNLFIFYSNFEIKINL